MQILHSISVGQRDISISLLVVTKISVKIRCGAGEMTQCVGEELSEQT